MVSASDFRSQGREFEAQCRQNSVHNCMMLHCIKPFIITLPLSRYDLNNVERDVKH